MSQPGIAATHGNTATNLGGMNNDQPPLPKWLFFIHIAQVFFAVLILGLCAYAEHIFSGPFGAYLGGGALGFGIFASIWTFLVVAALLVIPRRFPQYFFKWILLGVIALTTFFWLVAFASLASWASAFSFAGVDSLNVNNFKRDSNTDYQNALDHYQSLINGWKTAWRCMCVSAAFGAIMWVLFIVTLVFWSLGCHKLRVGQVSGGVEAGHGGFTEQKPVNMGFVAPQHTGTAYAPTPNPEYQQQQQYAQSESNYAPTPNPEYQLQHQQQPQAPTQTYTNPQFSNQAPGSGHEMPTH